MSHQYPLSHIFKIIPTPSVLLLADAPKFTIFAVNNAYLEAVNIKEEDLIGKGIFEAFPENPDDKLSNGVDNLRNSLKLVIATTDSHKMPLQKYDIPTAETSRFKVKYANVINIPLKDDHNNITHILHSLEDVTEQKNLEIAFQFERQRFTDLYLKTPFCMGILKGPNHIYEMANPQYLQLIGKKDIIGKKIINVLPELEAQGIFQFLDTVYETGETFSAKEILVKIDYHGNKKLVDTYRNFIYQAHRDSDGIIDGILFFVIDVTELVQSRKKIEQSEKKYRQIVETAQEGIWVIDEDNRTTFVNNKLCEILGYTKDEMMGKDIYLFMDEEARQIAVSLMQKKKKEGKTDQTSFKFISKSGHEVWTYISSNPLFDETGIYKGSLAMLTNITERKSTDEKLKKLNKELADQNKQKEIRGAELSLSNKELLKTNQELDRFVYSVSHDLRSPLTSILGLISFIEEDSREPDTLEQIKMIRASINRLDGFIKNILSYSQNNRTGIEMKKIPIKKTIHEIVDSVSNKKEAEGISFQVDIDEKLPFYSDSKRFFTILDNLISNAIRYHTKEVSGRYLKLTGKTGQEELILRIADNGIGIDPQFHDKIFDMFYRLPSPTPGSGFGLYIVKETLEKLQGKIEIQSIRGLGSTFIITLKNLKNERRTSCKI